MRLAPSLRNRINGINNYILPIEAYITRNTQSLQGQSNSSILILANLNQTLMINIYSEFKFRRKNYTTE